jgi:hypothetical protein
VLTITICWSLSGEQVSSDELLTLAREEVADAWDALQRYADSDDDQANAAVADLSSDSDDDVNEYINTRGDFDFGGANEDQALSAKAKV